ncbi:MAG TPA: hypothetical protein PK495_03015 [Bacteroidales bacterium]|nr:hypothetical protein [Bacteroidales bacterium]
MKKVLFIISAVIFSVSIMNAQPLKTKAVPKEVINQFKIKNKNAKSVKWEKEEDEEMYVANFKDDKNDAKSYFTSSGEWLKTMFFVEMEDLPTNIINYTKKTYPTFTSMEDLFFIKEKGVKDYYLTDIYIVPEKIIHTVKFTATGRFISESNRQMPESFIDKYTKEKETAAQEEETDKKSSKKGKKEPPVDPNSIAADKLPPAVLKTFKKRFVNASDIQWYYSDDDEIYRVSCVLRGEQAEGTFTKDGAWINTTTELQPKSLPSAFHKSIAEFYANYTVVAAWKEIRADKQDHFIIDVIEGKKSKSSKITKMIFDKGAKIIKIIDAEEDDNEDSGTPEMSRKERKAQARMEKEFKKHQKMEYEAKNINESELPSGVGRWIAKDYPEYTVRKAEYKKFSEFSEHGSVYKVLIQRPGVNQPHATGYFTHNGELLKVVDEFKKEEPEKEAKREVSAAIVEAFNKNNPNVTSLKWKEGEDNTWIAVYKDKGYDNEATYTESATWMGTITIIEPKDKIPSSIRSYVAKQLPDYEIQSCRMISNPNEKPYYNTVLYDKKQKSSIDFNFTIKGKPME